MSSPRLEAIAAAVAGRPPRTAEPSDRPRAAVALILAPDPDSLLLIRRAEREGDRWSGQLALPGGRWDPGDPDLVATARRETLEEVGVDLGAARLIGALDDLAPRTPVLPPILVRPFLFLVDGRQRLRTNHEVAGAWWVELDRVLAPGGLRPVEHHRYGTTLRSVGYELEFGTLWGMTERIVTQLIELLRALGPGFASADRWPRVPGI